MQRIIKQYLKMLKEAKIRLLIFAASFVIGIIVGVFLNTSLSEMVLSENVVDFYFNAFSKTGNIASLIIALVISDALFLLIFYAFSYWLYLVALGFLFVFYRGYILGAVAFLFIKNFGVSGAFLYVFCVFIHNVLVTASLSCMGAISADLLKRGKACIKHTRNDLLIISSVIVLAAIIIEMILLFCILRPINYSF